MKNSEKDFQNAHTQENSEQEVMNQTQENENWKEQFLRVSADLQNLTRRADKERAQWIKTAQVSVIRPFLEFLDELELALKTSEKFDFLGEEKNWLNGLSLMQKNILKKLESLDIKQIDCSGSFDPNVHEALMNVDSKDHKTDHIVSILRQGYLYKNEVIRPAQVTVAR